MEAQDQYRSALFRTLMETDPDSFTKMIEGNPSTPGTNNTDSSAETGTWKDTKDKVLGFIGNNWRELIGIAVVGGAITWLLTRDKDEPLFNVGIAGDVGIVGDIGIAGPVGVLVVLQDYLEFNT